MVGVQGKAKAALAEAKTKKRDAESAITVKEKEVTQMAGELKVATKAAAAAAEAEAAAAAKEAAAAGRMREVRGVVEEKRAALRSEQSHGALLTALLAAKASGAIPGIHGRLGDLGAIDKKCALPQLLSLRTPHQAPLHSRVPQRSRKRTEGPNRSSVDA